MSASRLLLASALALAASGAHAAVFVNEIHYDDSTASGDVGEAIEVVATAGENLADYDIVLYNGNGGGGSYDTDPVPAGTAGSCGGSVTIGVINYTTNGIQNGDPDGIALVLRSNSSVIQFLSYDGSFTATNGPAVGMVSVNIGVAETNSTAPGTSLQLGGGPGSVYADFTWNTSAANTFGACNTGQTFGAAPDVPPTVSTTVPANGAGNVSAGANLSVQFSEAVTTNAGWFGLNCASSGAVTVVESGSGAARTLDPVVVLAPGELCTATIAAASVIDQDGTPDPMASNYQWTFTIAADLAPTVASTVPANLATGVSPFGNLSVQFSEAVTTNPGWFGLNCASSGNVAVSESGSGTARTLDPVPTLAFGEQCTATITAANVLDQDGTPTAMAANYTWSFTITPDNLPTVASTSPANGVANVPVGTNLLVNFSEPVTVSGSWFTIACANSGAHPAQVSGGPQNYTLNPDTNFDPIEDCTVTVIASQVLDQDGNPDPMAANHVWSFITAAGLANYYQGVDSSSATALRATLHAVIDDHTRVAYTNGTPNTWAVLNLADQDPVNTNQILDVYKNASYNKITGGQGAYNREHTWPNSLGFGDNNDGAPPSQLNYPYTDTHMLYLSDTQYNANRGNKYFGTCSASCTEDPTNANHGQGGGVGVYPGNSNWYNGVLYEVWDRRKGDMARAMFYMDIRYEGGSHGVTGAPEPDLRLTDNPSDIVNTNGNASVGYMGLLSVLLQWHIADPITQEEVLRNGVIQSFQGNRNPFIDHPEWVACIYQGACTAGEDIFRNGFE